MCSTARLVDSSVLVQTHFITKWLVVNILFFLQYVVICSM
uniref:Uncharacterized protein n=1 Tax=Anguilla anguilla TaxID=7936 RepID=A0A0E9URJ2_ANGAN